MRNDGGQIRRRLQKASHQFNRIGIFSRTKKERNPFLLRALTYLLSGFWLLVFFTVSVLTVSQSFLPTSYVGAATISSASGKIAFVSNRDGNEEIYTMNPDGTGVARLTNNPAIDRDPVWSPDGMFIAFASTRDGSGDIYIMNADGSNTNRLTTGGNKGNPPTWSPDGSRLAYASTQDGNLEIYAINANGTGAVRLTNHPQRDDFPTWSPDGMRIAFHSMRDGGTAEIYVMNVDGTGVTQLTYNTADDVFPKWSPDGTKIVYRSETDGNAEIYTMNPDGSGGKRLTFRPFGFDTYPAWSPDGKQIVFVSDQDGNSEIYTMDAEGIGRLRAAGHHQIDSGDWELSDFNGDGKTDLIRHVENRYFDVFFANGTGQLDIANGVRNDLGPAGVWQLGDFNHDGKTDLIRYLNANFDIYLSDGAGHLTQVEHHNIDSGDWRLGDFNGDGNADILRHVEGQHFDVFFTDGTGQVTSATRNTLGAAGVWQLGDFNHDGKTDLIRYLNANFDIYLSDGAGHLTQVEHHNIDSGDWRLGDFNGDGNADILRHVEGQHFDVFFTDGTGQVTSATRNTLGAAGVWQLGDFNHDGKTDLIRYLNANFDIYLSDGAGYLSLEARHVNFDAGNWNLGDFNGDGKADLIRYINAAFDNYLTEGTGPVKRLTTGAALDNAPAWQPVLDDTSPDADYDGYSIIGGDCDDADPDIHPGATEVCDGVDDDCDGQIDEGVKQTFYRDSDNDGFGTTAVSTQACAIPSGYVVNSADCNDSNAAIKPNATESCNNVDDDCDGQSDEGFALTTFYRDSDGDGFGNIAVSTQACSAPTGYVALLSSGPYAGRFDCDDTKSTLSPANPASVSDGCDGVDNDCDGLFDENVQPKWSCSYDRSGRQVCSWQDPRKWYYRDADGDQYGALATQACSQPKGYVPIKGDCNDANAAINPKAAESCNGVDDNCNTQIDEQDKIALVYRDADNDGYGDPNSTLAGICSPQTGYVSRSGDCNDTTGTIKPGAPEVCGDGVDWDCDGKDPECPPQAALVGLEATQVVQDWRNSVKLISGKPTYVRAHIDFPATYIQAHLQSPADAPLKVRGTLEGIRVRTDGSQTSLGTISSKDEALACVTTASHAELCDVASRRSVYNGSLNFQVPSEWLAQGILKLKLSGQTVAGSFSQPLVCGEPVEEGGVAANCEIVVRVQAPTTLKVKFVKVAWSDSSGSYTPTDADIKELHKRLQAIYPASVIDYTIGELGEEAIPDTPLNSACAAQYPPLLCRVNDALIIARELDRVLKPNDYFRRYYGVLKGPDVGGLAVSSWVSSGTMPDSAVSFGSTRHAHEIAHSLGLLHAEFCGATGGEPFPFTTVINGEMVATLGPMNAGRDALVFGLNTAVAGLPLAIDPSQHFELMSYCGNTKPSGFENTFKWISTYNYERLRDKIFLDALQIPAVQSAIIMALGGSVNLADGAVTFSPFVNVESMVAPETPPPGDYTLQLLDASGNVLQEVPFQPDEAHQDLPEGATPAGASTTGSFFITVPANEAIKQVVVLHQGNSVGARSATPHAPQVTVLTPNGGEDLSGETATVQWTGSDADGDPLSYIVQYSSNDGATWETLGVDRPETSVVVPVSALAGGSQGRIRVIASDGFNSTNDMSDGVFTVANKAPLVSLLSPADGRLFVTGEVVALRASVIDKEDGELSGDQVVWTSDLDGALGTGIDFSAPPLSEGEHIVSVTATDSSGSSTVESVRIRVMSTSPTVSSDLSLSQIVNAEVVLVGNDATFTVLVKNTGPDQATDVTLVSSVQGNVVGVTTAASQGTCQVTDATVTCSLGNLADDATAIVTVTATANAPGLISHLATVSGTEIDPALADNTDTKTITVLLDSDGDGTPDDVDGCPADAVKTAPGGCGCSVAETDTDGDGTPDCTDGCPSDAGKTHPGSCGCSVADSDADGDGTLDCVDACPNDAGKTGPGVCGCGVADTDTDGDGALDCTDTCPSDAGKTGPGLCGCGVTDTDTDGDGMPDCRDGCPSDAGKTHPGGCGCSVADSDADGDGTLDCIDACPNDVGKTGPGECGCGVADTDADGDGTLDCVDNCPTVANFDQTDSDSDGQGDACDGDDDNDGVSDEADTCPYVAVADQTDTDSDGQGDACDADDDSDEVLDLSDNCQFTVNTDQADNDADTAGDACDTDDDNDGILDMSDNCPFAANVNQADLDSDGRGNACDDDLDNDGAPNTTDNCEEIPNADQRDLDHDGAGDACDVDDDGDGVIDGDDNCPATANSDQDDQDADMIGDICDADRDGDGIDNNVDNCPLIYNLGQDNTDGDAEGNACDDNDDNDRLADAADNCPLGANDAQENNDNDEYGDVCDADDDNDGVMDGDDNCPLVVNAPQLDADSDGGGDACDADDDNDGIEDVVDNCQVLANADQRDADHDGYGDACDADSDGDGVNNGVDNCPSTANPGQQDLDGDGHGDACDPDIDGDGIANVADNCSLVANASQMDLDADDLGDVCDGDIDNDGIGNVEDNCIVRFNPDQTDFDGDRLGDVCDGDVDADGTPNVADVCPFTVLGLVVDPLTGCAIAQLCPCSGPRGTTETWKNHGKYVSCVSKSAESFVGLGLMTPAQKDATVSAAAQSTCGK